jgi:hypothetical protein
VSPTQPPPKPSPSKQSPTTTPKQSPITTSHEYHPRRRPPSHASPEHYAVPHQITTGAPRQSNTSRSKTNQCTKNRIKPNTLLERQKPNQTSRSTAGQKTKNN